MVTGLRAAVNRDPDEFPSPTTFDMDRPHSKHISFGLGNHLCLGAHLARLELAVALRVWHEAIPNYRLANDDITEHGGLIGLKHLRLAW